MSLSDFKLIPTPAKPATDPRRTRRERFVQQIDKQTAMARAGEVRRRGRWWTFSESGKPVLAIKYGRIPLELAKGKHAIACENLDQMISALEHARNAAFNGDYDNQLETISTLLRTKFTRAKGQEPRRVSEQAQ